MWAAIQVPHTSPLRRARRSWACSVQPKLAPWKSPRITSALAGRYCFPHRLSQTSCSNWIEDIEVERVFCSGGEIRRVNHPPNGKQPSRQFRRFGLIRLLNLCRRHSCLSLDDDGQTECLSYMEIDCVEAVPGFNVGACRWVFYAARFFFCSPGPAQSHC